MKPVFSVKPINGFAYGVIALAIATIAPGAANIIAPLTAGIIVGTLGFVGILPAFVAVAE